MTLIIPKKLGKGSKIAIVTHSWGGPGELLHRYAIGVKQFKDTFGVNIVEMENTLASAEYIYNNPEARAKDLMTAFSDSSIDGIVSSIGGDDSIRLLPYINYDTIRNNPKVFLGYSDSTILHFICHKAGIMSYYGPSIMSGFAENCGIFDYMIKSLQNTIFKNEIVGEINQNKDGWTNDYLDWANPDNQKIKRRVQKTTSWKFIQGKGQIQGELLGGCIDVFPFMFGTDIWPKGDNWKGKILFIETAEESLSEISFERILRTMGVQGVLKNLNGIIMGRSPNKNKYDSSLIKIIKGEFGLDSLPIITNMDFGHTDPMFVIPIGSKITLDFDAKKVSINQKVVL